MAGDQRGSSDVPSDYEERSPAATLLPDPEPAQVTHTVISVDDHVIEPPDLFEGRMPRGLRERAPRVVERDGAEMWVFEDRIYPNIGLNAVVGRPRDEWSMEPARFDEMRRGCWDPQARVHDMDLAGIAASLNFPSLLSGFAGANFARASDPLLGLACVRAYNDWHIEEWAGHARDRLIPLQIPWLQDPEVTAAEVHRNAARGCPALSFPEHPTKLKLPSLHSGHWDPVFRACVETDTVLCLHTGSASWSPVISPEAPIECVTTLFPVNAALAAADWVWSGVPVRFPSLAISLSEGGLGWVPMLLDRLDYVMRHSATGGGAWQATDVTPSEVLKRNFWFCSIDDPSTLALRHRIGVDHIMVEVDYPHADSTWPDTQSILTARLDAIPTDEAEMITWRNASELFRHELTV